MLSKTGGAAELGKSMDSMPLEHPLLAWHTTTVQLSFPFGVLLGIGQSTELPLSLTWPVLVTVVVLFTLWVRSCRKLHVRQFFTKHKNQPGFKFVALTFIALGAGGANAGGAAAWYIVRGYMGVAMFGSTIAVTSIVFALYAYPKGRGVLKQVLSSASFICLFR